MSILANSNKPNTPLISSGSQEVSESSQAVPPRIKWLSAAHILIAANFLIFWAMLAHSAYIPGAPKFMDTRVFAHFDSELLRKWGGNYGFLTLSGQYWRVITSLFLHLTMLHLTINMLFRWGLGMQLDRLFGRAKTFAIYLLTGVAASLVSLGWHPTGNSVGSSGAIYGLAGVLIALLGFAKLNLPRRNFISIFLWVAFLITPFELAFVHLSKE